MAVPNVSPLTFQPKKCCSRYTGVEERAEHEGRPVLWQIAARRSTYKHLGKRSALYKAKRQIESTKAQVRAKVEHPFLFRRLMPNRTECSTTRSLPRQAWPVTAGSEALETM